MRTFLATWLGLVVSWVGSALSGFALAVSLYQRTGSVTLYALIGVAAMLPAIALSSLTGTWIDRHDRRSLLLISQAGHGACVLGLALLAWKQGLEPLPVVLLVGLGSCFRAIEYPTLAAATTLLVPSERLGQANGLVQLGYALSRLLAPVVAGSLLTWLTMPQILLIDAATFVWAVLILSRVRFPGLKPEQRTAPAGESRKDALLFGWRALQTDGGLLRLLGLFAALNFTLGMVQVLVGPLVLGFADASVLGWVQSVGGLGMVTGGVLMSAWKGPAHKARAVVLLTSVQGALLFLAAARPTASLVAMGSFGVLLATPIVGACSEVLWQQRVPPGEQGRVFAVRSALTDLTFPLAYLVAGPLADGLLEPAMAPGGALSGLLGPVLGTGPGRGIAVLFLVLGLTNLTINGLAWLSRPYRALDQG